MQNFVKCLLNFDDFLNKFLAARFKRDPLVRVLGEAVDGRVGPAEAPAQRRPRAEAKVPDQRAEPEPRGEGRELGLALRDAVAYSQILVNLIDFFSVFEFS